MRARVAQRRVRAGAGEGLCIEPLQEGKARLLGGLQVGEHLVDRPTGSLGDVGLVPGIQVKAGQVDGLAGGQPARHLEVAPLGRTDVGQRQPHRPAPVLGLPVPLCRVQPLDGG
ncbi:MAG: hypothetical protein P8189_23775 [Anaerolineae bacterium]